MSAVTAAPVDLNALGSDDFAIETAEMRYARRHGGPGASQVPAGHDDPAPTRYAMQEGVWRPDGRGANETIYQPFYWGGRKVRALKPAPKTRPGEQWQFPNRASNDNQIGIMTGDARFAGNEPMVTRADDDRSHFNRFQALQRHNKNPGLGGAAEDALYGLDEGTASDGMRLDQAREAIANGESGRAAQARPMAFMQKDIERQVFAELEKANHDSRAMQFLLDPEANAEYNTLAMGAAVPNVNTTGDYNVGVEGNLGVDRGLMYLSAPGGGFGISAARAGAGAGGGSAGAAMSDTLNAVKVRTADMQGIHTWAPTDSYSLTLEGEDAQASRLTTHSKDQSQTTKLLFGRSSRGVDVGLNGESDFQAEQAPLTMTRRYKRKEQDQGANFVSATSDRDMDGRDVAPLTMARAYRRKEQDQGGQHASLTSDRDVDGRDVAPLTAARRARRKEVDRVDHWIGSSGMDVGDTQHRQSAAAPRKRQAETARRMTAALLPGAGYDNAGEVMGRDVPVLSQVPNQEARGIERSAGRKQFGIGAMRATETLQFEAQSRIDPLVAETNARTTQLVNLRDRRAQQSQISVRGYDEMGALQAAYEQENGWVERGRGRLGQPMLYESGDESGGDESGAEE